MLLVWNVAPVCFVAALTKMDGLAATAGVLDISDIVQFFDHVKSSSFQC